MAGSVNEMLERVARAIEDQMASDANHPDDLARAAIAAMREPTKAMIEAGWRARSTIGWTWRVMIGEALR